jgi:hypothetical protein
MIEIPPRQKPYAKSSGEPLQPSLQVQWHARLRENGIKLRDTTSFGCPGWAQLVSSAPDDVQQLLALTEPSRGSA